MGRWWPLVAICLGAFMLLVDVTIVTVALPEMAAGLHASFSSLQWVLDVYALALAALLLGVGSLADLLGRRRVYLAGLVVFAAASLACGLAGNAGTLIAARAFQGLGGAAMFTATMALLTGTYQGRDRGIAFGVWGAVNGAAAAAGPILGGLLTQYLDWRAIFLVNLPVSALTVGLVLAVLTESRPRAGVRVDVSGMLAFTVCAGGLTYALIHAGDHGWAAPWTIGPLAGSAAMLAVFLLVERRSAHPLLDLTLFRRASFVAVLLAGLLLTAAAFAGLAFTSVWLQDVLGLGPIRAGLALVPMAASAFVVSALAGRFLHGAAARLTIGGGLFLVAAGAALQGTLDAGSGWRAIAPGLIVVGVGVGVAIPALSSAAMASVPAERGGMAAGALNTFRQLGYALGVAVLGLVFRSGIEHRLDSGGSGGGHPATSAITGTGTAAHSAVRAAVAAGLDHAYLVAAALGLAGSLLVVVFVRTPAPTKLVDSPRPDRSPPGASTRRVTTYRQR